MVGVGAAGLALPVYATAGTAMFFASYLAPHVSQEQIRSRCPDSPKMAHDLCHMVADNLARPGERGSPGFLSRLASGVGRVLSGVADSVKQAMGNISQFINPPSPPQAMDEPIRRLPNGTPSETVSGTMTDGTIAVDVTGTVTPDGDFNVADDDGEVRLQMSIGGGVPVEGSFEWNGVEGKVEVDPLSDLEDWGADDDTTTGHDEQDASEAARRAAEEARRLAEQAASGLDGTSTTDELNGDDDAAVGSTGGRPILIKPLPNLKGPVGAEKTIDLTQHFRGDHLTFGGTRNTRPDVATATVKGSTLTLQTHQAGTTQINITAWNFVDGTCTTDTMEIQVIGSSSQDDSDKTDTTGAKGATGTVCECEGCMMHELGYDPVMCMEYCTTRGGGCLTPSDTREPSCPYAYQYNPSLGLCEKGGPEAECQENYKFDYALGTCKCVVSYDQC